jgi:hypothetical protein
MMRLAQIVGASAPRLASAANSRASHPADHEAVAGAQMYRAAEIHWQAPLPAIRTGFFPLTRLNTYPPRCADARAGRFGVRAGSASRTSFDYEEM